MSDFVNYKKRDASLPPGCKDLIDVLHGSSNEMSPSSTAESECLKKLQDDVKRAVPRRETSLGHLADLKMLITRAYQSQAVSVSLNAGPLENLLFHLDRYCGEEFDLKASVWVEEGSELHRKTRAFFSTLQLQPPEEPNDPSIFFANVPVIVACDFGPLLGPHTLAALATAFFRHVCLLTDASEMAFDFVELIIPSSS